MHFDTESYIALVGVASVLVITAGFFIFLLTRNGK